MAKVFDSTLHLPLASEQLAELKACAKFRHTQATSLARQLIAEGLVKLTADKPKPEKRKEYDYNFQGMHISNLDRDGYPARCYVDTMLELGMCDMDARGDMHQTERNWDGKHTVDQFVYQDDFYAGQGTRWLTEDSPTMLEDRLRGTYDWDAARARYLRDNAQPVQHTPRPAIATPTSTARTVDQPDDTPTKSLEQLLSDD